MPDEAVGRTRAALLDSVDRHFVSDVPVGIFLSGGVDSTALLALAHHSGRREIRTFSIGVDDASRDESEIAKRTAAHFGTQHTELRLTAAIARELFPRFLESVDQPTIDGFNTYSVAGIAREHGMKVVLNGLGGDELFAGYPSFEMLPRLLALSRIAGPARGLIGATLECAGARGRPGRLGSALRAGGSLAQLYSAFRGVFSRKDAAVLAQHFTGQTGTAPEPAEEEPPPNMRDAVSALEIQRYMRNQLLRDSDVMSMAHGLELRVPLVDRELFEVIVRIPAAIRLRPGKQLLLDAVPEIPAWVRGRAKRGFLFPYESWLGTDEWRALMAESSQDLPVRPSTWYQKWAVFVFRHWERAALKSI
jgi:asparagine synthase (glutamine-hydrolysing)